jgi:hypothetical protein
MDDNKNDDLTKLIPEMNQFSSRVAAASSQDNILINAQRAAAIQARKQAAAQEKLGQAISNTTSQLVTFASGLTSNGTGGNFSTINRTIDVTVKVATSLANFIPVVGGAFAGLAEGAGEVAKFMVGQFAKAYGNFEKLSDTGVVTTFEDMRNSARTTGLNFDDTAKIFTKYSKEMSVFGNNAILGRRRVDMIMAESKEVSLQYQKIGMSVSEFAETQVQYISQLQRSGALKGKTDKEIRDGSVRYIETIDTLSKMTGISRTELKNQIDERMRNSRYLAGISRLGEKQRTEINKVLAQFSTLEDKDLEEGVQDIIAADGRVTTDKAKAAYLALSQGGMDLIAEVKKIRGPAADAADFMNKSMKAAKNYNKENKKLISTIGTNTLLTRPAIGMANLAIKQEMDIRKIEQKIADDRKKELENTTTDGSKLAATRRSLYESGKTMELLATDSKLVTGVMSTMATGLDNVTSTIYSSIGEKLPPYLQLRKEENESIQKTVKLQKERVEAQNKVIKLKEETEEEKKDPKSQASRSLRRYNDAKAAEAESQIRSLDVQIKDEELKTEEIRKKRVGAEGTPGGGSPSGAGHPGPKPESSSGSSGSSSSGSGSSGSQSGQGHPGDRASGASSQSGPGLGSRESERNEVSRPGYGERGGTPSDIGSVAEKYESSGKGSTTVGWDSKGGTSYGKKQISSRAGAMTDYLKYLEQNGKADIAKQLRDAGIEKDTGSTTGRAVDVWKQIAASGALGNTETEFLRVKSYNVGIRGVKDQDLKTRIEGSRALQEMMYSTSVQHGPGGAMSIINSVFKKGMTDEEFIRAVYAERGADGGKKHFSSSAPNVRAGVVNRFVREQQDIIAMLKNTGAGSSAPKQARTGGIFRGPSTGYLAELHGDEAVIPVNDGMAKQQLGNLLGGNVGSEDASKIFKMMTQKINTMISIAGDGVGIQKKAKKANVTMA